MPRVSKRIDVSEPHLECLQCITDQRNDLACCDIVPNTNSQMFTLTHSINVNGIYTTTIHPLPFSDGGGGGGT